MKVRYYFDDGRHEDDILPRSIENVENRCKQYINEWNDRHPEWKIKLYEVIDPFLHTHDWKRVINGEKSGGRDHFACVVCGVTGIAEHTKDGTGKVKLNPVHNPDRHEYCHEPKPKLKPPKFK